MWLKLAAREKDGDRAQDQVQVLGMRNERQKDQDTKRMGPPESACHGRSGRNGEGREVGDHQREDEERNHAGFVGDLSSQPYRTHEEAAYKESGDGDRYQQREDRSKPEVEATNVAIGIEEAKPEAGREVVQRDESEGEEAPEDEGVCEAGKRALLDDLGLAEHLPEEVPDPPADRSDVEVGILPSRKDVPQDAGEAGEEADQRKHDKQCKQHHLPGRERWRL